MKKTTRRIAEAEYFSLAIVYILYLFLGFAVNSIFIIAFSVITCVLAVGILFHLPKSPSKEK